MISSRKTSPRAVKAALLATSMLYAASAVQAQEADYSDDEIIVTAQKRNESAQDVPIALTAIGTEKLDQLQVNEIQDYVKFLPSVTIQASGPGASQIYFRGVASGEIPNHSASLPTVGIYLDEMPITTIQGSLDIHVYDMARVEALAGPQGTLYGASSMAGTIKMVSNAPDYTDTYGEIGVELNRVKSGDVGGQIEGFINAKLADNAALRLVGWYRKDGGYIDNVFGFRRYPTSRIGQNNAALIESNYNDVETYGGRLSLGIEIDDSWTITPTVMGQVQKADGSFAQERSTAVTKKLQTVQYNPESSEDKWLQAALTIEGKIGSWDVTAAAGHLRRKGETESDYSDYAFFYDALYGYGAYFYDNAGNLVSPNQYIQGVDTYRRNFAELRIASPSDAPLRFIGGIFYQRQSHLIEQNYIIDDIADSITVTGTDSNIWLTKQKRVDRDIAAFGEVSFDVTDKLTLTGGLRVYKYKNSLEGFFGYSAGFSSRTGEAACFGPPIVSGSPCTNIDKTTSDTDFIHKLNATYKFNDDALIYATWSRGFRPGGVNRRGTLPPYGADELDNYELGWKTNFGPLRWNGAIYQQDWNNIQLSFLGANGLTEIRNAGIARIRGIETDLAYRIGGLSLSAGASYNDATIRRDFCRIANADFDCTLPGPAGEANALLAPSGSRLPVTAKFKGNAVARYEFPVGEWDGHVQIAGNYIGSRRSDLRPVENAIVGNFGSYGTVDLSIGMKNDEWTAEVFATNLFDNNGIVNASAQCGESICGDPGNASITGGVFYDFAIKPRIIGVKLAKRF
jgi:outer membrane receptor protein involved in Fe transport